MSAPLYVALLHYPITNRRGEVVTTAVTNLDIHDISRSARTYGVKKYFIVTPIEVQHEMVRKILGHWHSETSKQYHPDRVEALSVAELVKDFSEVKARIREAEGVDPEVVLTDARPLPNSISYAEYRQELEKPDRTQPALIVFGTGWGIAESFYPEVDRILAPVNGPERDSGGDYKRYNHLSVRAAVAVILDRLCGQ